MPELAGTGYAGVPVRDVLSMTSGVDWVEDHRDPSGPGQPRWSRRFAAGGSSRALLARVGPRCAPGTRYEYCTADSQVLDWVRERATGVAVPPARGAALVATWAAPRTPWSRVDGDGVALAGGGLAATARRLGPDRAAAARRHAVDGTRLLDRDWVRDASRPSLPFLRPGRLPSVACPRTSGSATTGGRWTTAAAA